MPMTSIGSMSLKNQGGFVTRIQFTYIDDNGEKQLSSQSGDIPLGQQKVEDPGDLGVPDGSIVYMHAFVVWGTDNEAHQGFLYQKGNGKRANYAISGTTLGNSLGLTDVS